MSKIWTRFRRFNGDTLVVQKRSYNLFIYTAYIVWKLFIPKRRGQLFPDWGWIDWTDYSNKKYIIKKDMNWHAEELIRLHKELQDEEDRIKAEIKRMEKDTECTIGYSAPFKEKAETFLPIGMNLTNPGDSWKKVTDPRTFRLQRKTASGKDFGAKSVDSSASAMFFPEELSQFSVAFDAMASERGIDHAVPYKHEKKQKGGGGGNFNPNNRKKQQGESPEGHQDRLSAIRDGLDVSNWIPY